MEATLSQNKTLNTHLSLKERASRLIDSIDKHEIFMIAGSLAYTTALAIAPFVLILLSAASFLSQDLQTRLYAQLSTIAGAKAGETIAAPTEAGSSRASSRVLLRDSCRCTAAVSPLSTARTASE